MSRLIKSLIGSIALRPAQLPVYTRSTLTISGGSPLATAVSSCWVLSSPPTGSIVVLGWPA